VNSASSLHAPPPAAFAGVPFTPQQHLRLALFGVIARIIESYAGGDLPAALKTHPFLSEYLDEILARTDERQSLSAQWQQAVDRWEREAVRHGAHLPLTALRDAGLSPLELELVLAAGLTEEDPRFGGVFESVQRDERRPTFALLMSWWRDDGSDDDRMDDVRRGLQRLLDHGLLELRNADAPRVDWVPAPVLAVWDILRGEAPALRWLRHLPANTLPSLDEQVMSDAVRVACNAVPDLLDGHPAPLLLLRGPVHNGRKTLAAALSRALGKAALIAREPLFEDAARWRLFGALSAMTDAVPIVELELGLGESRVVPPLPLTRAPIVVVSGRHGAWAAQEPRRILTIDLPLPAAAERQRHWSACWSAPTPAAWPASAAQLRLSSGHIRTVAASAASFAKLAGRNTIEADDLRRACRTLQSGRLETIATRLEARGSLADLAVDDSTREDLATLVTQCRWRERLAADAAAIAGGGVGVRALFAGPSGAGKTLAARLLAAELGKDLYRVDLAATVNKYLGETEKNLNRALTAAEELDVVLLIDEGDALMASRTDVGSSNDRYANLETNFLLQRIESFEGILVVTTNAADRIDRAFARRMDVVVNFRSPDAARRFEILKLHLADHAVDDGWLQDAASRCALNGGQLRNAVSHARLLSLQTGRPLDHAHLQAALAREYRKSGGTCPLRPMQAQPCRP
jgi:DNA polymerase III delta prime subunit